MLLKVALPTQYTFKRKLDDGCSSEIRRTRDDFKLHPTGCCNSSCQRCSTVQVRVICGLFVDLFIICVLA